MTDRIDPRDDRPTASDDEWSSVNLSKPAPADPPLQPPTTEGQPVGESASPDPAPPVYPAPPGYSTPPPQYAPAPGYGTAPTPDPYAAAYGYPAYPAAVSPKTNPMSITALACGIACFVCCLLAPVAGPAAVVFGIIGLRQTNENPAANGGDKPMAIAGLVLGALSTIGVIVYFVFLFATSAFA